jgi:hypothetical protein
VFRSRAERWGGASASSKLIAKRRPATIEAGGTERS